MPHRDPHHRSDPESTFDTWLDALVTGTPANDASQDDPIARAQVGARQLHGLAASAAMPGTAVQQRIREDLMQSGALAAGGGGRWIPERRRERQVPWWSPVSPVLATALAIAMVVALVISLVMTQRPVGSPGTSDAPGFAVASPEASPTATTAASDLLVLEGATEEEALALADHVALINEDGLTIYQPDGGMIELPDITSVQSNTVPRQALVTRSDDSRAVVDLTTGETLFDLPSVTQHQSWAGPYLFVSESGANADWRVHDTRTGKSRPLSEIVELPEEPPVRPVGFGGSFLPQTDAILVQLMGPGLGPSELDNAPMLVIAGSLDRAATLDSYAHPSEPLGSTLPVFSDDGTRIAWGFTNDFESYRITVVDTTTGEELASVDMTTEDSPGVAGFLDSETLVITTPSSVELLTWTNGESEQETVVDGLSNVSMPLLHAASQNLYVISGTPANGTQFTRISLEDRTAEPVIDIGNGWFTNFTTAGSSWIFLTQPGSASLIDARSGEVVSRLPHDAEPEPQYSDTAVSTSFDGSTVLHHYSWRRPDFDAYLLSPRLPSGLVLSAPVEPGLIDDTTMQGPMPVVYTLSADGTQVVVSIADPTELNPQMIGAVAEDPGWTELSDDIESVSWLPMPAEDEAPTEPQRLPAQDFGTPVVSAATPSAADATPAPFEPDLQTSDDVPTVNLRAEPTTASTVTVSLPTGTPLMSLGEDAPTADPTDGDRWLKVAAKDSRRGWVREIDLEPYAASATASPIATPESTSALDGVVIVEGDAEQARIEGDIAFATLGEDGLTIPLADGETVTIPDVAHVNLWSFDGQLRVSRDDRRGLVVDPATGEVVHELIEFQPFSQQYGRWYMVPTDDTLTDWTIVDTDTGQTRLLSRIFDLPGDEPLMPFMFEFNPMCETHVLEIQPGSAEDLRWNPSGPPIAHVAIAGSPERIVEVQDYPTVLDRTGKPAMVEAGEGRVIAYETRTGDDRIVVVDTRTGEELARYGVDTVGEDPTLAGFTEDQEHLVATTDDRVLLLNWRGDGNPVFTVRDDLEEIGNPLLHVPEATLYFTQGDTVMRLHMPTDELTEIASGFLRGGFPGVDEMSPWQMDADGDTIIIAIRGQTGSSSGVPGSIFVLSPEYPNGLEITGPSDEHPLGNAYLSPDGTTLYADTRKQTISDGDLWVTPLGEKPSWGRIAEGVDIQRFVPFDGNDS